jgi:predicted PurR-regulated permease PerM
MNTVDPAMPVEREESDSDGRAVADRRRDARRQSTARTLLGSVVVIAVLYTARQVFIPIALAVLFAFLLRPIVNVLERTFIGRRGGTALVMALTITLLGLGAWALVAQANTMAREVVKYSGNLEQKFRFFKSGSIGSFGVVERTLQRITETSKADRPDMKVRVVPDPRDVGQRYKKIAPTIEFVASSFLVVVLVFFLLDEQERMRDRLLRIAGRAHLTVTTQALGETAHRISRFLLTQAAINIFFGLLIGIGLFFIGVPHPVVWGVLAAVLRFVPYIGAVLSGGLPAILALAIFPGWVKGAEVLALFLVVDQSLAGFIEPAVIGHRVGVSPVALLVATIFWGWLWGPVGLLLATPITVCLTVGGEFIPALRIFSILFGTDAPLEDYLSFYNRLLTRDRAGAAAIADRFAEENSMEETFEELFIPTLSFASEELNRERITRVHDHFIKDTIRELIVRLGDRNATLDLSLARVVAVSVSRERLSLGTLMLSELLRSDGRAVDYFTDLTDDEVIAYLEEARAEALLVACSNPDHLEDGLRLIALVREKFPELVVMAGGSAFGANPVMARDAGATFVPTSLAETRARFARRRR